MIEPCLLDQTQILGETATMRKRRRRYDRIRPAIGQPMRKYQYRPVMFLGLASLPRCRFLFRLWLSFSWLFVLPCFVLPQRQPLLLRVCRAWLMWPNYQATASQLDEKRWAHVIRSGVRLLACFWYFLCSNLDEQRNSHRLSFFALRGVGRGDSEVLLELLQTCSVAMPIISNI